MVPEDLLFWIAPMSGTPHDDQNVLCLRHADAMSVPRGWTLDDRREEIPRLFMPRPTRPTNGGPRSTRSARKRVPRPEPVEQLVIDGTGEIERPAIPTEPSVSPAPIPVEPVREPVVETSDVAEAAGADEPWRPAFDQGNDLDGLLEVSSPLLARAFRGTDRPRA